MAYHQCVRIRFSASDLFVTNRCNRIQNYRFPNYPNSQWWPVGWRTLPRAIHVDYVQNVFHAKRLKNTETKMLFYHAIFSAFLQFNSSAESRGKEISAPLWSGRTHPFCTTSPWIARSNLRQPTGHMYNPIALLEQFCAIAQLVSENWLILRANVRAVVDDSTEQGSHV